MTLLSMPIILPSDFDTTDPDDEWIAGLGDAARCLMCAAHVADTGGIAVVRAAQVLVVRGPCAAGVAADLIADARELEIGMGLGQDGILCGSRLTRNVLRASEDSALSGKRPVWDPRELLTRPGRDQAAGDSFGAPGGASEG